MYIEEDVDFEIYMLLGIEIIFKVVCVFLILK